MNLERLRRAKLSKAIKHFLRDEQYAFYDSAILTDELKEGYYIRLVSKELDYQTSFDNSLIDNSTIEDIIELIELNLSTYLDEDE